MKKQQSKSKQAQDGNVRKVKAPKQPVVSKPVSNKVARTEENRRKRIEKDRKAQERAAQKRLKAKAHASVKEQFNVEADLQVERIIAQHEFLHELAGNNVPTSRDYEMVRRWKRTRTIH